jgi:hypothetical protein
MNFKKLLLTFLISISAIKLFSADTESSYKLYGFVRNEWYINSRQNVEALDGIFNIFPKPIEIENGIDKNALPNSQMLAISSRLGIDFTGTMVFGAKTSAKIECDFAGISTSYYLIRLRQAYLKFNWKNSELLIGQTWHPMFSNLQPLTPALSVGNPFQPFNRSPQIRFTQNINQNISFLSAATYQMQYLSQGPLGSSASYMKNGLLPDLYAGFDYKSKKVIAGFGVNAKSILVNYERLNSASAFAYAQFSCNKFHVRAKTIYGQNLSEFLMIGGYGVSGIKQLDDKIYTNTYTNFNTSTSWLSFNYGTKVQIGVYGGFSKNLGTNKDLLPQNNIFTAYGYGFYKSTQILLDQLYRVSPNICYNIANFKFGFEYELTNAKYGKLQKNGLVEKQYNVNNHRLMASISYIF